MRNLIVIALAIFVSACTTGPFSAKHDLESSSQQQGQTVACSGYKVWPDCYKAAKQTCPNGYEILAKEENQPSQTRALRISCK